jgi:hypothetical protein
MSDTFDLSDLQSQYTERAHVTEATAKETVYKGGYDAVIARIEPRVAGERSPFPGRRMLNLRLAVQKNGKSVTLFQEVSFDVRRKLSLAGETLSVKPGDKDYDPSLPMDKPSKLWCQLVNIVDKTGRMSDRAVVDALSGTTVNMYVLEGFQDDNNQIAWPEADPSKDLKAYEAQRSAYIAAGRVPKNYISSFKEPK